MLLSYVINRQDAALAGGTGLFMVVVHGLLKFRNTDCMWTRAHSLTNSSQLRELYFIRREIKTFALITAEIGRHDGRLRQTTTDIHLVIFCGGGRDHGQSNPVGGDCCK